MKVKRHNANFANRNGVIRMVMPALQVVLLPILILTPIYLGMTRESRPELPEFNNESITIGPLRDDRLVVSDQQLIATLKRLEPKFTGDRPKVNHVDHALRFWGVEAEFESSDSLSGQQMRELLINHSEFANAWGKRVRPLLTSARYGVAVRTAMGPATTSHVDHLLASIAEVGTPLDFPVEGDFGKADVDAMLRSAIKSFSLNQQEYEWTVLALALYAVDGKPWYSKEGQKITFDSLADRIMRQSYSQGVCYGNHRLYTLTILLRVDDAKGILSDEARQKICEFLTEATRRLIAHQHPDGYWDETWARDVEPMQDNDAEKALGRRMLVTGHALEWWALAPAELLPPREVIVKAAQWIVKGVAEMTDEQIKQNYTFLSHAGRALTLWRKQTPAEFYTKRIQKTGASP